MGMFVSSTTLHEATNGEPRFPTRLRALITLCIQQITTDELSALLAKHEADPGNLDGRIEANLRELDCSLKVKPNCRVSRRTGFNADLVIESEDAIICLEIEKGNTSRFELDILKMLVFAHQRRGTQAGKPAYGAFIVPTDNLVARHISGNARESSYEYLTRLLCLVAEADPCPIADILVVGYGASEPVGKPRARRKASAVGTAVCRDPSLELIKATLGSFPLGTALGLRARLREACPDLQEKLNPNMRYLGYAPSGGSDALYVYLQKPCIVLDLRIPKGRASQVRAKGFEVREKANYQSKAGWLTGVRVPYDTDRLDEVVNLALTALRVPGGSTG